MDPSDKVCIEVLRPKNIPEGLVALGTVVQISEIQLKLQITGGIICLVDRFNVNQIYKNLLEEYSKLSDGSEPPPKLSQMFKRGQQYICKIIDKRPRKGYDDAQDIIATLDPSIIQEDNLAKTLLTIPQLPIQGVIKSVEDHGYQMDIGFTGLTGFLTFDEAESYCAKYNNGKKFFPGQVIRCCLKNSTLPDDDSRIVHLALKKENMKKSEFTREKVSEYILTEKCILPGSKSFLTVMKVRKDGLVVNFMNEFAGFVGINHLRDEWHSPQENYKISDQFDCTVLYFNNITKTFALSIRTKSKIKSTLKNFIENYHVGQIVENAKVAYLDSIKSVNFKVDKNYKAIANVRDALNVDIYGMTKDELHLALDSAFPDESIHTCRIKSINLADLILVVSLKQEFMDLPYVSVEELKPADFIEAIVKKHVKDGIIVTFGLNLRAIILNSDLHDFVSIQSFKRYPIGKTIKCRVLKVDISKQPPRVYLTNKEQLMSSDTTIIDSYDKSWKGKCTHAIISKVKQDGLIVELFNNVKGFIPSRFLSSVPLKNVSDLFKVGQVTSCVIYRVNPSRQSLLLGVIPYENIIKMKNEKKTAKKKKKELKLLHRIDKKNNIKNDNKSVQLIKSRRQRSEEAKLREDRLREAEKKMIDPNNSPQSILDFERLILKNPDSADSWTKYSKFFLDSVETEKARIVCRRALKTINFRMEKEKLKIWLHLIKIEVKYGGTERIRETIKEATQTNDKLKLYQGTVKVLTNCGELDEAENIYELMLKSDGKALDIWIDYIRFHMEHRKDLTKARVLFDKACKSLLKSDLVILKSRFAQFEFKYGDVERGKTMFEILLSDNPKRKDLWKVYEAMVKKFGTTHMQVYNKALL